MLKSRAKTLVLMNQAPHPTAVCDSFSQLVSFARGPKRFSKDRRENPRCRRGGITQNGYSEGRHSAAQPTEPRVQYMPQWNPDYFDMKPIAKLISEAQVEAGRK